ncbi:hypothetical protein [Shewanella sp.]|uniref:hypothetical protein n=1 Tax=Shewanella sp. TaxID=50422 RepID=UPI003D0AF200
MTELRTKWLVYTVGIGLLPIFLRLLLNSWGAKITLLSASDFVAFGFVLHISILNEIEYINGQKAWKTFQNGLSILGIFVYGAFSCALMLHEAGTVGVDFKSLLNTAIISAIISFLLSLTVFFRPNTVNGEYVCP